MITIDVNTNGDGQLRGSTTALLDASTGVMSGGTWQGTAIDEQYGGTGLTSYSTGDILYASGANTLATRTIGSVDDVLTVSGGVPIWAPGVGSTVTLQEAYEDGNTITTDSGNGDIDFGGTEDFNVTLANIDFDPTGDFTVNMDATKVVTFTVADNLADAFLVQEGANNYIDVTTTDAGETINFGNATTNPDVNFDGTGTVTIDGALTVDGVTNLDQTSIDTTDGDFAVTGSNNMTVTAVNIDLDPTGSFALDMDASQTATVTVADNLDGAFTIKEGANEYISLDTSDAAELLEFGNDTTNPDYTFHGTGTTTIDGALDVNGITNLDQTNINTTDGDLAISGSNDVTVTAANIDLDPTGDFTLDMDDGKVVTITVDDNQDGAFTLQEGANNYLEVDTTDGSEIMNIGNATTNPDFQFLGSGTLDVDGNVVIDGDLLVNGTTTTVHSENVNIDDNYLFENQAYTTAVAQTGGVVVNYLPTATATDTTGAGVFTPGVAATSNPTVTVSSSVFSASDIIMIDGSTNGSNDGLFEVLSDAAGTLTIRGIGTTGVVEDFSNNQFTAMTDTTVTITKVTVSVIRCGTDGAWEVGSGAVTGITYADLAVATGVTLQQAYETGNTITTSGSEGNITFTGTEDFIVSLDNIDLDPVGNYTLDMDATKTVAITIADNLDASYQIKESTNNYIEVDTTDASEVINFGNATTNPDYNFDGTGTVAIDGALTVEGTTNLDQTTIDTTDGNFSITGSNNVTVTAVDIDLDPTGDVTLDMDDGKTVTITVDDNQADALLIQEGANNYIDVTTTDASEAINFGNATTNPDYNFDGTGTVAIDGALTVEGTTNLDQTTVDTTDGDFSVTGSNNVTVTAVNIDLDPTGTFALDMDASQTATVTVADNLADAFLVQEGANNYIDVTTTNGSEAINLGNATTNQSTNILGTGTTTISGDLDVDELITPDYNAGENMANPGVAVYMAGDGDVFLADKDSSATVAPFVGILTAATTTGNPAIVAKPGSITTIRVEAGVSGLDEGQLLYIGDSGELTNDVSAFAGGDTIKAVATVLGDISGVNATALVLDQVKVDLV